MEHEPQQGVDAALGGRRPRRELIAAQAQVVEDLAAGKGLPEFVEEEDGVFITSELVEADSEMEEVGVIGNRLELHAQQVGPLLRRDPGADSLGGKLSHPLVQE